MNFLVGALLGFTSIAELQASSPRCSPVCSSCLGSIEDVYDPSLPPVALIGENVLLIEYDSLSYRSIMRKPSDSTTSLETSLKSVRFSEDTKDDFKKDALDVIEIKEPHIFKFNDLIKESYKSIETDEILCGTLYDYETESGDYWINFNLPKIVAGILSVHFPALCHVKLTLCDLAGLVIFASYHSNAPFLFNSIKHVQFYKWYASKFSACTPLIILMKNILEKRMISKTDVFDLLVRIALKNYYRYTIEAFYSLIGDKCLKIFIKNTIKYHNQSCFKRFFPLKHQLTTEKMMAWSLEFANIPVYMELMKEDISAEGLCKHFKKPIILSMAKDKLYFPGLVDLLAPIEGVNFSEMLSYSMIDKNLPLFKDLIKYENSFFENDYRPALLNPLRSIFIDANSDHLTFETQDDFTNFIVKLLKFDCEDENVIEAFRSSIPEIFNSKFREEVLEIAAYLKNKTYLNLMLSHPGQESAYIIKLADGEYLGHFGVWEFVHGSVDHFNFMKNLVEVPGFDILHAIGNPEFPQSLWPRLIGKLKERKGPLYIENEKFRNLSHKYGFANDSDLSGLGLELNKTWSLLELAILNFNPIAVCELLENFSDRFGIESSYELAKNNTFLLNRSRIYLTPRFKARVALYRHSRERHPEHYVGKSFVRLKELKENTLSISRSIVGILKRKLNK